MGGEEKIPKNLYIYAFGCKYFTVLNFFFFSILRMNFGFVSRIPKTTLRLDELLERSPDSENKLTFMVHYSKKMSTDISKGKRVMVQTPRETRHKYPGILSQRNHMDTFNSPSKCVKMCAKHCQLGKLTWALEFKVLSGGSNIGMWYLLVWLTSAS